MDSEWGDFNSKMVNISDIDTIGERSSSEFRVLSGG